MTLYGGGLIFAILFLGAVYVLVARKVWHGESGLDGDVPPEWWFLGDETWRGVARAYIATAPFALVFFAGALVAELATPTTRAWRYPRAPCCSASSSTRASCCGTGRKRSCPRTCATSRALAARRPAARQQRRAVG